MEAIIRVYAEAGGEEEFITTIENVDVTRSTSGAQKIYFSVPQWIEVLTKTEQMGRGYREEQLRFYRVYPNDPERTRVYLLAAHNAPEIICEFVGGSRHGRKIPLKDAEMLTASRTEDLSLERGRGAWVHRRELDNVPKFVGYIGPMWDGIRPDGTIIFRYETQEVYDLSFD